MSFRSLSCKLVFAFAVTGFAFSAFSAEPAVAPVEKAAEPVDRVATLRAQAMRGEVVAQVLLGGLYLRGHGVQQSNIEALYWYVKASEAGSSEAAYQAGRMLEAGLGDSVNPEQAAFHYRRAESEPRSLYCLARLLAAHKVKAKAGEDVNKLQERAVALFTTQAAAGELQAATWLGVLKFNGHGTELDYQEAVALFKKGNDSGDPLATYHLGLCFYHGYYLPRDIEAGVKLLEEAHHSGIAEASQSLLRFYRYGIGRTLYGPQPAKAAAIEKDLIERGYPEYQYLAAYRMMEFSENNIQIQIEAMPLLEQAAAQGHPAACAELGAILYEGRYGVKAAPARARQLAERAAEQGLAAGRALLARITQDEEKLIHKKP